MHKTHSMQTKCQSVSFQKSEGQDDIVFY